jgi:hypothetical protein
MVAVMMKAVLASMLLVAASPALAGASGFTLVNGTGAAMAQLSIRRSGTQEWKALGPAPSAGARMDMKFSNPDCAFDIRANVAGVGPTTWAGVNLCDVKSVTLNRDASAGAWVDYDH